jgi:hypothetical protein
MRRLPLAAPATIRPAAVAGSFYPEDRTRLRQLIEGLLATTEAGAGAAPKAVIAPHAGYQHSGPIAASAFAQVPRGRAIRHVVILGPSHHVTFRGVALSRAVGFDTPLGAVPLDKEAAARLSGLPQARVFEEAHTYEHSLEVELPFLQSCLQDFAITPLVIGDASDEAVGELIDLLWGGPETLFVISTDLSHYYDYETASELDRRTARAIEQLRPEEIGPEHACGRVPVRGLLWAARRRGLRARTLDLRNSGDTAGPRESVVGYGAFAFAEE